MVRGTNNKGISWKKRSSQIRALQARLHSDKLKLPFPDLTTKENHPLSNTISETRAFGPLTIPLSLLSRKP